MLSFVVPAYNEELGIARTLTALSEAGAALGEPFEIVVADDAYITGQDGGASIVIPAGAALRA